MSNKFHFAVDAYKVCPNKFSEDNLPEPAKKWADPHLVTRNKDTGEYEPVIRKVKSCTDTEWLGVNINTVCYLVFDWQHTDSVEYVIYYTSTSNDYEFEVYNYTGNCIEEETESYVKKFNIVGDNTIERYITFKNPESKIFRKMLRGDMLFIEYRDGSSKTIFFEDENN